MTRHTDVPRGHSIVLDKCVICDCRIGERLHWCPGFNLPEEDKKAIRSGKIEEFAMEWTKVKRAVAQSNSKQQKELE